MSLKIWLASFAALFLAACNPVANFEEGEKKVDLWQEAYDQQANDKLWAMTGSEFRKVTTREQFDDLLKVINGRLGLIQSTERTGFNVNSNLGAPTTTVISMQTVFEQGEGTEVFTFHGKGEDMKLVGWQVNSDRLAFTADDLVDDDAEVEPTE